MTKLMILFLLISVIIGVFQESSAKNPASVCFLKPDPSVCLSGDTFWAFDSAQNKCIQLTGCMVNANSFETEDECKTYCPSSSDGNDRIIFPDDWKFRRNGVKNIFNKPDQIVQ